MIISIVDSFQNYSFIKSYKTDLYQLVFYKFSSEFAKDQKGQFLTPLGLINFLVNIVNPRGNERLIDPCTGISDFLSVSYVNSEPKLNDSNLYGIDNDEHMVMLSQLNMLLNGDGNAKIEHVPGYGSINKKFDISGNIVELNHDYHQNGNWDNWVDETELMKFDVVLTNPPFGKGRAFKPKNNTEKKIAELYELWNGGTSIDEGILFLENAVRLLKENGRFGIVLSNSIASVDRDVEAREWLMNNVRIVALFELPTNVFADTNVNTVLIVGYKPDSAELERLKENDYEIFAKTIENVGYEVKTVNKIKTFKKKYKIDEKTFEVVTDENGEKKTVKDQVLMIDACDVHTPSLGHSFIYSADTCYYGFTDNLTHFQMILKDAENLANRKLQDIQGYLFEDSIVDCFAVESRPQDRVNGYVFDPLNDKLENKVVLDYKDIYIRHEDGSLGHGWLITPNIDGSIIDIYQKYSFKILYKR